MTLCNFLKRKLIFVGHQKAMMNVKFSCWYLGKHMKWYHTNQQYDYAITWCLSCGLARLWLESTLNSVANECLGISVCVCVSFY